MLDGGCIPRLVFCRELKQIITKGLKSRCVTRALHLHVRYRALLIQGRSQGRVPGVLEPPFWVMKMNIISRGKKYRNPPFEIPRNEIFVFEEEQNKINFKRHHMLYRRLQYYTGI